MAAVGEMASDGGRPSFLPFRVAGLWNELSEGMRASITRLSIVSVAAFRGMFDGSEDDALEFVGEAGGVPQDVAVLVRLWNDLESADALNREFRECLQP